MRQDFAPLTAELTLAVPFGGCCGGEAKGGRIATVIAGPRVRRGFEHAGAVDHYGTLGTIERALGLPALGAAKNPRSGRFTNVFRSPPRIRASS